MKHTSCLYHTFVYHAFRLVLLFSLTVALLPPAASAADQPDKDTQQSQAPAAVSPDQPKKKGQQYVTIDFNDVDINMFIKYISELTGKNFIVDRSVKGKITVISPTKMSEQDAYRVFESVLEVHGYTTVPSGPIIKIVPAVQARSKNIPMVRAGEHVDSSDKVVTRIVPLQYSDPDELKKLLTPLLSKTSVMIAHPQSGVLIMTDVLSNINRLMDIIEVVDVPSTGEEMEIIPLRYASAADVGKSISQLFARSARRRTRTRRAATEIQVIPYERTNSLIVFAPKTQIDSIRELVQKLDTEAPRGGGKIHVYYLQHADAEELVKVLTNLPTQQSGTGAKKGAKAAEVPVLSTDLKITADPETNSLIITAPKEEYLVLEDIIRKLDIPRRMVYLEALIMEVSIDKIFQLGVEWGGLGSFHDETGTLGAGFTDNNFGMVNGLTLGTAGMPDGTTLGILKKGVEISGIYFPDLGSVVNAFKTDSDINIIATPQILTTDNKEASIAIVQNVPYITSKNTSETGSGQDYTNYEYKDVGTTLKITPQINQDNLLRLDIEVAVDRLKSEASTTTPSTFKRTASTTVVLHNEEIVVIGGMVGNDTTSGEYKVPLLGDIPLLGWLFKTHEDSDRKTNMFIFIMPRIVESSPELAGIYEQKRNVMDEASEGAGDVPEQTFQISAGHEDAFVLIDMGYARLQKKKYAEAKAYFEQALELDPDNQHALLNMGTIYEHEGEKGKAIQVYEQILNRAEQQQYGDGPEQKKSEDKALVNIAREKLNKLRNPKQIEPKEPTGSPPGSPEPSGSPRTTLHPAEVKHSSKEPSPSGQTGAKPPGNTQAEERTIPATEESCGNPWKTPLMEIRGKVKKVEYRKPPWSSQKGLHLDVEIAGKQNIVVHVFPEQPKQLTKQCQDLFTFKQGEIVTVSGSAFFTKAGSQPNICAAAVTRNAGVLNLRTPTTGRLEKGTCCQEICRKRCTGRGAVCRRRCMDRCSTEGRF
ncbi:MAG: type II secretion system secretin GspD [Candidatus Electrothrix sp. YB6]